MDDQPSLSMSSSSSSLFEKPEFNETETNDVTYGAMCVVLQQDGFQSNQIEAAGIQRDGRQSLIEELANTICRITDEVGRDEEFKQTINRLKVSNEQHAYEVFRDASWNVAFRSGRAITWTRVAGLLVLAGKLASKVLSLAANVVRLIRIITSWVSRFIRDYLWSWIADSGGWTGPGESEELQQLQVAPQKISTGQVVFVAGVAIAALAVGVFIGRSLQ